LTVLSFFRELENPDGPATQGSLCKGLILHFLTNNKQETKMKVYALLMIMLVALAGCSTTYKGSIDGAYNQPETKNGVSLVQNTTGPIPSGAAINR